MFDVAIFSYIKQHCQQYDCMMRLEFVSRVDKKTKKPMRAFARELQVDDAIRCVIHGTLGRRPT